MAFRFCDTNFNSAISASAVTSHTLSHSFSCCLATIVHNQDPVLFKDAIKHEHWVIAMNLELDAFEKNCTWEITELPPQRKAIGCKWLYKTKFKPDGSIDKYKARLVVLGCRQTYGIDYTETFAPVAKMTSVRAVLAVAAMHDWDAFHMDVSNAFIHGNLNEIVYMRMPPGYTGLGSRITCSQGEYSNQISITLVCRLKKSLYGLKQAPREWFTKLSETLLSTGYTHSKADYSLFTKKN